MADQLLSVLTGRQISDDSDEDNGVAEDGCYASTFSGLNGLKGSRP